MSRVPSSSSSSSSSSSVASSFLRRNFQHPLFSLTSFSPRIHTSVTTRRGRFFLSSSSVFTSSLVVQPQWSENRRCFEVESKREFATSWKISREPMIPFPVTPTRSVPAHIPRPDYALKEELDEEPILELDSPISIKTEEEVEGIKRACSLARSMLELAGGLVRSGITTDEIDRKVHSAIVEAGGYPSLLGNDGFPKSLHTNLNEVLVQGIPDCRPLTDGDVLTINLAVFLNGFHGACGATYYVGSNERLQEDHWAKRLIHNARRALAVGCSQVKPNAPLSRVGAMIEKFVVEEERYGVFADNLGHGIGQRLFEMPYVFHTATDLTHTLEAGMVFTIEPVVTEGDSTKQTKWKNGFTLVTRDRGRSAQFKETVLVTPQGFQILTAPTSQQTLSS